MPFRAWANLGFDVPCRYSGYYRILAENSFSLFRILILILLRLRS